MKHNIKGIIALVLAVAMILSCGIFASGSRLFASTEGGAENTEVQEVAVEAEAPAADVQDAQSEGYTEGSAVAETQEIIIETEAVAVTETEAPAETEAPEETEAPKETESMTEPQETEAMGEEEGEIEEGEIEINPVKPGTTEDAHPDMDVILTQVNTPKYGTSFVEGESVEFAAEIVNKGDVTLTGISLVSELTGATADTEALEPGTSSGLLYLPGYVITPQDAEAGFVVENVMVRGYYGGQGIVLGGEISCETEVARPELTVYAVTANKPENGAAYVLGERIICSVFVTNTGNVTLSDVEVLCDLTGESWSLNEDLEPGVSTEPCEFEYVVTELDIENCMVTETFSGSASCAVNRDLTVIHSEETNPTMAGVPSLYVSQKVSSGQHAYDLGDEVSFDITVLNNGEGMVKDIAVADELSGMTWSIDALDKMASVKYTATYTVTEEDILAGKVVNQATATGTAQDPDTAGTIEVSDAGSATANTAKIRKTFTIADQIIDAKDSYQIGDSITVQLTITNNGNVTQDVNISNIFAGGKGSMTVDSEAVVVDAGSMTVKGIAPGESRVVNCTYQIVPGDAGSSIEIAPAGENGTSKAEGTALSINVDQAAVYTVTVNYVYADGSVAAAAYQEVFTEGQTVPAIVSPVIEGFDPEYTVISEFTMPARSVEFMIIYRPVVVEITRGDAAGTEDEAKDDAAKDDAAEEAPEKVAAVEQDEEGEYVLTEITDGQVPLGERNVRDTYYCILHWMLAILIVAAAIVFVIVRRKQAMRLADMKNMLKKELDENNRK